MAYSEALNRAAGSSGGGGENAASAVAKLQKHDFSAVLSDVVNSTVQSLQESEKAAAAATAGKADIVDVVTSVTNAELSLQTVVAVRDKVIEAYQDIMKMPI
jgi:flagellar hook-basal body complex protein FliE